MSLTPELNYSQAPVMQNEAMSRLSNGFLVLTCIGIGQLAYLLCHLGINLLSQVAVQWGMWLMRAMSYVSQPWGILVSAGNIVGYVMLFSAAAKISESNRRSTRLVYIVLSLQLAFTITYYLANVMLLRTSMTIEWIVAMNAFSACFSTVMLLIIAYAISRVTITLNRRQWAAEYWAITGLLIMNTFIGLTQTIFWMLAFKSHVSYGRTYLITAVGIAALVLRIGAGVWCTLFYFRAWRFTRKTSLTKV